MFEKWIQRGGNMIDIHHLKLIIGRASTYLLLLMVNIFLVPACKDTIIIQDLSKIFRDKVPHMLETVRNPMSRLSQAEKKRILKRVASDEKRSDLIEVAVIDSGVDVSHPELIDQIKYTVSDGKILSSGIDINGKTSFASNLFVDPTIFAYGAKEVDYLQIKGAQESPVKIMKQADEEFKKLVLAKIALDPVLNQSIFANLTTHSLTIFRYIDFEDNAEDYLTEYQELKRDRKLIQPNDWKKTDFSGMGEEKAALIRIIRADGFNLTRDAELPELLTEVSSIKDGDRVMEILRDSFRTVDKQFQVTENVRKIGLFLTVKKKVSFNSEDEALENGLDFVKKKLPFILWGYKALDPIRSIKREIEGVEILKGKNLSQAADIIYDHYVKKLNEMFESPNVSDATKRQIHKKGGREKIIANLGEIKNFLKNLHDLETDPQQYQILLSKLRKNYFHSNHLFLSEQTLDNTHGTHVAGIIAEQDPRIRIVPVRMTVQSVDLPETLKKKKIETMFTQVLKWLELPIARDIVEAIISEYGIKSLSDRTIKTELRKYLNKNSINVFFVEELFLAIEEVGQRNIPLANVSLGTLFKKKYDDTKQLASIAEDIFAEFVRYETGVKLQTKALNTLFLIATGNDGAWIDGVSKTTFPVGITSLRAKHICERKKLPSTPNNQTSNVLAVGSVTKNRTLTPFSNILIDPNVPTIFSTGESIISTVPGLDRTKAESLATKAIVDSLKSIDLVNLFYQQQIDKLPLKDRLNPNQTRQELEFLSNISEYLAVLVHARYPILREKMSGTSMASPTATGLIAKMLLETGNPYSLSPAQVIAKAFQSTTRDNLSRTMTIETLVDQINEHSTHSNERQTIRMLNQLLKPGSAQVKCHNLFE